MLIYMYVCTNADGEPVICRVMPSNFNLAYAYVYVHSMYRLSSVSILRTDIGRW